MTHVHGYVPFSRQEMLAAFAFAREHPKYAAYTPDDDRPMMNMYMLRTIGIEIARKRQEADDRHEQLNLLFITGATVREHVPDVDKPTGELGAAYKGVASFIFTGRKEWAKRRRTRKRSGGRKNAANAGAPADESGQFRLL